jgi:hypothetical protein
MKKYIPYIVIVLMVYLLGGFIRMQFNPAYWEKDARIGMICVDVCAMLIYTIVKFITNDMKE